MAGELSARDRRLEVLGRPERRRAGLHVDVRCERPVDHGRSGPHDLGQRDPGHRLGVLQRQGAGERDGGHRAGERERRHDRQLARGREVDQAHAHRDVELARGVAVDHRVAAWGGGEGLVVDAVADAEHLEPVLHLAAAARVEVRRLVGQGQVREAGLEVPELDGDVLRLDARAGHVHDVEVLRQTDEVAEVGQVARALASVEVADGGRARHGHGRDVSTSEERVPRGRAAEDLHRLRCESDRLLDETAVERDHLRLLVDRGAGRAEVGTRLREEDSDPLLLEDPERRLVQVRDLVGADDLEGRERELEGAVAERALLRRRCGDSRAAAAASPALSRSLGHHAARSRNGSPSASRSTSMPRPMPAGGRCAPSARGGSPPP